MAWNKAPGGVQDLTFGLDTETQFRVDKNEIITQINSSHIPHESTVSVKDKLDTNKSEIDYVNSSLNDHLNDKLNPHDVTVGQIGGAAAEHTHSEQDVLGLPTSLSLRPLYSEIYTQDQHINVSVGTPDAGKPIILDNFGKLDATIMGTGLALVGSWNPSLGQEYPDLAGTPDYPYWIIEGVGAGYTYTTGDLNGQQVISGDYIIKGIDEWVFRAGVDEAAAYYRLDGTVAISAPFAGGSQQIKNISSATEAGDAVEYGQWSTSLTAFIKTDGSVPMAQNLDLGGFNINNLLDGVVDTDGATVKQVNDSTINKVTQTATDGAINTPIGTVAQRPAVPSPGHFRYNTDGSTFEGWNGAAWTTIGSGYLPLTGGTVTGPINLPVGAIGSQAIRADEVNALDSNWGIVSGGDSYRGYTKLPDGTLIQHINTTLAANTTTVLGLTARTWLIPFIDTNYGATIAFTQSPAYNCAARNDGKLLVIKTTTAVSGGLYASSTDISCAVGLAVSITAIGRWK